MGETVKEMLVRQGIEAGRAGNTGRHGMGASLPREDQTGSLADAAGGGQRIRSGMEKGATAKPRQVNRETRPNQPGGEAASFAYVVYTNHAVPTSTRKRVTQTPFLVLVK